MDLTFVNLVERPDLDDAMWSLVGSWPRFMLQDPVGSLFFGRQSAWFPAHQVVALDPSGAVVARLLSAPFRWDGRDEELPARGWDEVLEGAYAIAGTDAPGAGTPTVSLLEARIEPGHQGQGLSGPLLRAGLDNAHRLGVTDVVAPVRPTRKWIEPRTPIEAYARRTRSDGLPVDPWLRTHVRAGGRVVRVCPLSMTIPGTLAEWREWTGLPLAESGPVDLAEALVPLHVSVEQDHAVYVEPNVWVHHRVREAR